MLIPSSIKRSLKVSVNDDFFVALCQVFSHSFLILGVQNSQGVQLLASAGKLAKQPCKGKQTHSLILMLRLILGLSISGKFDCEDHLFYGQKNKSRQLSYQAYSISYQQFVKAIHLLGNVVSSFPAYQPTSKTLDGNIADLKYQEINTLISQDTFKIKALKNKGSYLSQSNNCRHGVLSLMEAIGVAISSISRCFLAFPAYSATFVNGHIPASTPFYTLPAPPPYPKTADEKAKLKVDLLNKIYRRLYQIPKIKPYSEVTKTRFYQLKALYQQLSDEKPLSLQETLQRITLWRETNQPKLQDLRQTFFFDSFTARTPKTLQLMNNIEETLHLNIATI